jgi:hypothetical protein
MSYIAKQVNASTFDLFVGKGWENWSRISVHMDRMTRKFRIRIVGGNTHLPIQIWNQISKEGVK